MTDDSDGPWVIGSFPGFDSVSSYHTDPECPSMQRAKRTRPATDEELEDLGECRHCSGTVERTSGDHSIYQAAVAAGEDDEEAA